jgi:hypothetical protein
VTIYAVAGKRIKPLVMFLILLAAGYLIEHLAYFFFNGAPLGRLSIVTATHLESSYAEDLKRYTFAGLFDRFNNTDFPLFWKLVFLFYFLSAVFLAFRWKGTDRRLWNRLFLLLVISFTFLLTFAVKSIQPVIPLEAFQNRYFTPILPWMFLIIGAAVMELPGLIGRFMMGTTESWKKLGSTLCVILLVLIIVFYFKLYPDSVAEYAPELTKPRKHVISLYVSYTRLLDEAWEEGIPVVSVHSGSGGSSKAIDTVNRVFLNWRKREPVRPLPRISADGYSYQFIAGEGIEYDNDYLAMVEGDRIVAVDRFPFRVWISTLAEERERLQ